MLFSTRWLRVTAICQLKSQFDLFALVSSTEEIVAARQTVHWLWKRLASQTKNSQANNFSASSKSGLFFCQILTLNQHFKRSSHFKYDSFFLTEPVLGNILPNIIYVHFLRYLLYLRWSHTCLKIHTLVIFCRNGRQEKNTACALVTTCYKQVLRESTERYIFF